MTTSTRTPLWRKILKITAWTIMALVLTVVASLLCCVNLLTPEHLTRLTENAANRLLDAEVSVGRVELSLRGNMPLLHLRVDSVRVLSGPIRRLDDSTRAQLPAWADTLLVLSRFEGGINMAALLHNKIDLYDVEFDEPEINIVDVNDSLSNYLIYQAAPDTAATSSPMPKVAINRFSIVKPKPIRFHNAATHRHFSLALNSLEIDGSNSPMYALDLGGNVDTPELNLYNLSDLNFGIDGRVGWAPESPSELTLKDFRLQAKFIDATIDAIVDFGEQIIVRDYRLNLGRANLESVLEVLPDSLRRTYGLGPEKFSTDVAVAFSAEARGPFNLSTDSLPNADLRLEILPGRLRYERTDLRNVSGTIRAELRGNDLGLATVYVDELNLAGPATNLSLNLVASHLTTDPALSGTLRGRTDLSRLPNALRRLIGGYVSGRLATDIEFRGTTSMLAPNTFHKLHLSGKLTASDLYYLSSDTANLVTVSRARFDFGTHTAVARDSFLTANLTIDSADILHTQYSMKIADLSLGVGVSNHARPTDSAVVIPMGGDLKFGKFYLTVLGDSISVNLRDAHGRVSMQRYQSNARQPLFGLDIDLGRVSTGSPSTRFMLTKAHLDARAFKLPEPKLSKGVKKTADSLRLVYPDMPVDSVYARAIDIQRIKHKHKGLPRVHPEYTAEETEIIDWGTSKFLRRLLIGWDLHGNLTAKRASLFTHFFPLRNRVRNFNVSFSNDTILLNNVLYKAGSSDFQLSGRVSNLRRSLTGNGYRSPLKLNFELISDTIDINELASTTFRGSSYAAMRDDATGRHDFSLAALEEAEDESDEAFEREMGRMVADAPDSMAPLLIPSNIEAQLNLRANNVLYSDLLFHRFGGQLLISQGALNLHNLTAASDIGTLGLSALYSARKADDLEFGFGLQVNRFNIERFLRLVPAIDSIMPLLSDFSGIVNADIAATCRLDRAMNLELPSLSAAIRIDGDSLRFIDPETYKLIGKWLMFKDKQDNLIRHMNVEMTVSDNIMRLYPFIFDLDRYKLGVQGYNDLALNFDYHIAVLKSPIPFKFGVTVSGNPDKYKVRLGKARLNEQEASRSVAVVDTARVNLLSQIESIFRRGVNNSRFARLNIASQPGAGKIDLNSDTLSHADSLLLIREGLIPAPPSPEAVTKSKKGGKRNKKSKK